MWQVTPRCSEVCQQTAVCNQSINQSIKQSINQSINQSVRPIVAELLLGKVRNEKKTKTKKGYEKLIVCTLTFFNTAVSNTFMTVFC